MKKEFPHQAINIKTGQEVYYKIVVKNGIKDGKYIKAQIPLIGVITFKYSEFWKFYKESK